MGLLRLNPCFRFNRWQSFYLRGLTLQMLIQFVLYQSMDCAVEQTFERLGIVLFLGQSNEVLLKFAVFGCGNEGFHATELMYKLIGLQSIIIGFTKIAKTKRRIAKKKYVFVIQILIKNKSRSQILYKKYQMNELKEGNQVGQNGQQSLQKQKIQSTPQNQQTIESELQHEIKIVSQRQISGTIKKQQELRADQQQLTDNLSIIHQEGKIQPIHSLIVQSKEESCFITKTWKCTEQKQEQVKYNESSQAATHSFESSMLENKIDKKESNIVVMEKAQQVRAGYTQNVYVTGKDLMGQDKKISNVDHGCEISITDSGIVDLKNDRGQQQSKYQDRQQLQRLKKQFQIVNNSHSKQIIEIRNLRSQNNLLKKEISSLESQIVEQKLQINDLNKQTEKQTQKINKQAQQITQRTQDCSVKQYQWSKSHEQCQKLKEQIQGKCRGIQFLNDQLKQVNQKFGVCKINYIILQQQLQKSNKQLAGKEMQLQKIKQSAKNEKQRFQNIQTTLRTKVEGYFSKQKQYINQIKTKKNSQQASHKRMLIQKQLQYQNKLKSLKQQQPKNALTVNYVQIDPISHHLSMKIKEIQAFTVQIINDFNLYIEVLKEKNDKILGQLIESRQIWSVQKDKTQLIIKTLIQEINILDQQNQQIKIKLLKKEQDSEQSISYLSFKLQVLAKKQNQFKNCHNYQKQKMQKKIESLQLQINEQRINRQKHFGQIIAKMASSFDILKINLCKVYELEITRMNSVLDNYKQALATSEKIGSQETWSHEEKAKQFLKIKEKIQKQHQRQISRLRSQITGLEKELEEQKSLLIGQNQVHRSVILKESQSQLKEQTYCDILMQLQFNKKCSWTQILKSFMIGDVFGQFRPLTQIFSKACDLAKESERQLIDKFNNQINVKETQFSKLYQFLQNVINNKDELSEQNIQLKRRVNEIALEQRIKHYKEIDELNETIKKQEDIIQRLYKQISAKKEDKDIKQFYAAENEILRKQLEGFKNGKHLSVFKSDNNRPNVQNQGSNKRQIMEKKNINDNKSTILIDSQDELFYQPTLIIKQQQKPFKMQEIYYQPEKQFKLDINQQDNYEKEPQLIWKQKPKDEQFVSTILIDDQQQYQEKQSVMQQLLTASKILINQSEHISFLIKEIENFTKKCLSSVQLQFQMSQSNIKPNNSAIDFSVNNILWLFRSENTIFGFVSICSDFKGRLSVFLFNTTNSRVIYPENLTTTFVPIKCQQYHLKLGMEQMRYTWKSKFFSFIKSKNASKYFDTKNDIFPTILQKQRVQINSFEIFFLKLV